jgi:lysophospholipase L1-like esterase
MGRWMLKAAAMAALAAGAMATPASAQTASAAPSIPPAATPKPVTVGVLAKPCDALPPMPPEVADYMAKLKQAQADHKPSPMPTAAAMGLYSRWQSVRQAQDYADVCHYADENAALGPPTAGRVVYFGDSITELWKIQDAAFFTGEVLDRGVSGQTTAQMLIRYREDVINLHPRVVHIMAGTNDIAGNTGPTSITWIENNIKTMVEQAKANHIRVVLASIPPAARFTWRPELKPVESIATVNAWLAAYAREQGLVYVDYYAALDDGQHAFKSAWTLDGVHPNAAGYAVMEPLSKKAVAQAMRSGG